MVVTQPFARITTSTRLMFFRSLEEAYKASQVMIEPHKIWARDKERQQFVVVSEHWTPECSEPQGDTFGGNINNQWEG